MPDNDPVQRSDTPAGWGSVVDQAQHEVEKKHAGLKALRAGTTARRQWPWWLRGTLGALAIAAAVAFVWAQQQAMEAPTDEELDRGRRALLALVNEALVDHVRLHGTPQSLADVFPVHEGLTYRKLPGGGYELSVRLSDGQVLTVRNS